MTPPSPTTNRRQVALLALTLGVVMLGFGIVIPVYPFYIQSMARMVIGLSNSFTSLGRIVGPVWAGYTYDVNMTYPFWSGIVAMLVGFVVSLVWVRPEQSQNEVASGLYPHGHSL